MLKKIIEYKTSVFLAPLATSLITSFYILRAHQEFIIPYAKQILLTHILVFFFWVFIYFFCLKNEYKFSANIFAVTLFASVLSFYFVCGIYSNDWQTLDLITKINNGTYHKDLLYMSSIAESIDTSFFARFMIDSEEVIHYHTLSNYILAGISKLEHIPAIISYNYLLPIIFFPIYFLLQLISIIEAKRLFSNSGRYITFFDLCILILFNEGCIPDRYLNKFALWKEDYYASESFLIANILLLFSFIIFAKCIRNKELHPLFCIFFCPMIIFITSWAKISNGLILTCLILFYIIRLKYNALSGWILSVICALTYLACLILFKGVLLGGSGSSPATIQLFPFVTYCDGYIGLAGHYLILGSLIVIFVIRRICLNRYTPKDIKNGKTVWEEMAIIVLVVSFFPTMILKIGGGSAIYFTLIAELVGLVFFCGSSPNSDIFWKSIMKKGGMCLFALYCMFISINNMDMSPILYAEHEPKSDEDLFSEALVIRSEYKNKNAVFYICDDAKVLQIYNDNPISAVYVYTALTGIGTINASFYDRDELPYSLTGKQTYGYGFRHSWDHNLTLNEAKEKAKEMGKSVIIILSGSGFKAVSLD